MYTANIYNVFIASPGDVKQERELAIEIVNKWNRVHSAATNISLHSLSWENNLAPNFSIPGQQQINEELLEKADLLIAFFWTRVGTNYKDFKSATVAEIEFHVAKGKPAIVLFSNIEVSNNLDEHQLNLVKELKAEFYSRGLVQEYGSLEDFKDKLYSYIELTINQYKELFTGYAIDARNEGNIEDLSANSQIIVSNMAKLLSELLVSNSKNGLHIQCGSEVLFDGENAAIEIEWVASLKELLHKKLIDQKSASTFSLTQTGLKLGRDFNKRFMPQITLIKKPVFALSLKWIHGFRKNKGASYLNNERPQPINIKEVIWYFEISNTYSLLIKNISEETAWNIQVIDENLFDEISSLEALASLKSAESLELEGKFIQLYQGSGIDADQLPRIPDNKVGKYLTLKYLNSVHAAFEDSFIFDGKQFNLINK